MALFLNMTIYIVAFILFSLSIFGHGYFIKNKLNKKISNINIEQNRLLYKINN